MFDLNAKSFLKTAKFGLGMTILVLATACSHEVVQQAPIDTSASTGVESVPDATPTPEPSLAEASPLDNGSSFKNNGGTPIQKSSKSGSKHSSHFKHRRMLAKHLTKKGHKKGSKSIARRSVKKHSVEPVAMNRELPKQEKIATATAGTVAAVQNIQNPPMPPAPTPAAIGSVDGNLGNVDTAQIGNDEGFLGGLLGYWPYGIFALALGGGLFYATRNTGRVSKNGKRGSIVFNS